MTNEDAIITTLGSCIDVDVEFTGDTGEPEDITDDRFMVVDALPAALADAVITKTDAPSGKLHLHIAAGSTGGLPLGTLSRFRIARIASDGCVENTNHIWINVK